MEEIIRIGRKALHDRIWTKPVVHLAKEFGLSGTGLAKLCQRHDIPVPKRGFLEFQGSGQEGEAAGHSISGR